MMPFASKLDLHGGRPVFIGASPRSGTTLLRTMLNQHPDLGIPRETRFLLGAWKQRNVWGDLNDAENKAKLVEWIVYRKASRFGTTGIPLELARERLEQAPPTLGSVLGSVFELYAERKRSARWGDKRPGYIRHLRAVRTLFPETQIVNVVRDPRAAVASMRRLGWYNGSVIEATDLWIRSAGAGARASTRLDASTLYEVRYEDLIENPLATLEKLLDFLNLGSNHIDEMMNYHAGPDVPQNSYHSLISQPIDPSRIAAWKNDLTAGELSFIESATAEYMSHYGYEFESDPGSAPTNLLQALEAHQASRRSNS